MPLIGREKVTKMTEDYYLRVNNNLRGVYFQGLSNIVHGTPVDEGRARNNWFLSIGSPSSSTTTSKAKGFGAIRQLRGMPKGILNKKVFYTNNLPYIETLEYGGYPSPVTLGTYDKKTKRYVKRSEGGFSKQAPKGWVRSTLISMRNKIRSLS